MASRKAEAISWSLARDWVASTGVVPPETPGIGPEATLPEFALLLRSGEVLCRLLQKYQPYELGIAATIKTNPERVVCIARCGREGSCVCSRLDPCLPVSHVPKYQYLSGEAAGLWARAQRAL